MSAAVELFECLTLAEGRAAHAAAKVDRDKGIIPWVKCLGWHSENGRDYDPAGVDPALYEGKAVKANHVPAGAKGSVYDTVGWLEGCRKEADGIYAERLRLLNPKGEFEQRLLTAAECAPHVFGLSHTARGRQKPGPGSVIEAVEDVRSVDLVDDPATVASLYESRSVPVKKKLKDLAEQLKASRPRYAKGLTEAAESGILGPDMQMDEPAAPAAGAAETDHEQALLDAAKAVLDDTSMNSAEKITKIKAILKIIDGGSGGGGGGTPPEEPPATEEARRKAEANLREENARLKAQAMLRAVADEAKVTLTKTLLENLNPAITEAQAKTLVAELKGTAGGGTRQEPRSAAPWREEQKPAGAGGAGTVTEARTDNLSDDERKKRNARLRSAR